MPAWAELRRVDPPAGPGSGMPHLAVAADGQLHLSWLEPVTGGHALKISRWQGSAWLPAITAAAGANWFINWADFPSLLPAKDGALLVHWLERAGAKGKYGYGIRVAAAGAPGRPFERTWSASPSDVEDYSGFLDFVRMGDEAGAVYLAPPEPVAGEQPSGEAGHGGHHEHRKTLRFARFSGAGQPVSETEIDADVCSCCQTAAVTTSRGILVAYRDHQPGEIRDISLLRWRDGRWSEPAALHEDGWRINACPTDGPSLAAEGDRVAAAWFTRGQDQPRVQLKLSGDGGATFGPPVRLDDGSPMGRADVTLTAAGRPVVVWMEKTASGAEIRLRSLREDGQPAPALTVAKVNAARNTGFPKVASAGGRVWVAWREERAAGVWQIATAWLDPQDLAAR